MRLSVIKSFLDELNIPTKLFTLSPSYMEVLGSGYIPVSQDPLERQMLTCYVYALKNREVALIETSLSSSNDTHYEDAMTNYKQVVQRLISFVEGQTITEFDLHTTAKFVFGDYCLAVTEPSDKDPQATRVFITKVGELEESLKLRNKYLYSEV